MVSAMLWVAVSIETRTRTTSPDLVLMLSQYASKPASRNCRCSSRPREIWDTAATCTRLLSAGAADPGDALNDPVWGAVLGAGTGAAAAVVVDGAWAGVGVVVRVAWLAAGSGLGFNDSAGVSVGPVVRLDDGVADG